MFKNKAGVNIHMFKAHSIEYYERKERDIEERKHVKERWSDECVRLMASEESKFLRDGVRFVNIALSKAIPDISVERIKGKRKSPAYKVMVAEAVASLAESQKVGSECDEDNCMNDEMIEGDGKDEVRECVLRNDLFVEIDSMLQELIVDRKYDDERMQRLIDNDYNMNVLGGMVRKVRGTQNKGRKVTGMDKMSNRAKNKTRFARTQILYRKNRALCARRILNGEDLANEVKSLELKEQEKFWVPLLETAAPKNCFGVQDVPLVAMMPFTVGEFTEQCKRLKNGAPGSDGVMKDMLKNMKQNSLVFRFNIYILTRTAPSQFKIGLTKLIPKKEDSTAPDHYMPIRLSTMFSRVMHKRIFLH